MSRMIANSHNLLSSIYSHFYFPVYSNSLKDVAGYLGYRWADPQMSGALSVLRRLQWQAKPELSLKQQLVDYNRDDCQALALVTETLLNLSSGTSGAVAVSTPAPPPSKYRKDFFCSEFAAINKAAYWDHQRHLVYVKSSRRLRVRSGRRERRKPLRPTRTVDPELPTACARCRNRSFALVARRSRTIQDIKLSGRGVTRDVVRYLSRTIKCRRCGEKSIVRPAERLEGRYGPGFLAYVTYQLVELCLHQRAIARTLNDLLGFTLEENRIRYVKTLAARKYATTYDGIMQRIICGPVIHADETKITLKSGARDTFGC